MIQRKGKLSKRAADKSGFPIFPLTWENDGEVSKGFRETGFVPDQRETVTREWEVGIISKSGVPNLGVTNHLEILCQMAQ